MFNDFSKEILVLVGTLAENVLNTNLYLLQIVPLPPAATADACYQNVLASNDCGTIFHWGGSSNICACIRTGQVCDAEEDEADEGTLGVGIYRIQTTTLRCNRFIQLS